MKKRIIFNILIVLLSYNLSKAQIYTGVHLNTNYITSNNIFVDFGIGGQFTSGYQINNKIKCEINASTCTYSIYHFSGYKYFIRSLSFKSVYNFYKFKSFNTYFGLGTGLFFIESNLPDIDFNNPQIYEFVDYKESGLGILPTVGFEFKHPGIDNLNWDIGLSYYRIFTEHPVNLIQLKIGLLYYFDFKNGKESD